MSETASGPGGENVWPVLDVHQRRVLGVLVEKGKTTPDAYPLSLNALVTGCNQKSNRDPVMDLDEGEVEEALERCKSRGLVAKVIGGGRVERWRHLLYEAWTVDKVELAILGELLLRGAQTEGELRTRASRMEPIEDLEALRGYLRKLVDRRLVVYLTPEERRGAMLTHGFLDRRELDVQRHRAASSAPAPGPAPVSVAPSPAPVSVAPRSDDRVPALEASVTTLRQELEATRQRLAAFEKTMGEMRAALSATEQELKGLKQALGV